MSDVNATLVDRGWKRPDCKSAFTPTCFMPGVYAALQKALSIILK